MNLENKIKYQYMKILYQWLELNKVEKYLKDKGIKCKNIIDPDNLKISDYFFLQNDINLSRLNKAELQELEKYFTMDIKDINSNKNRLYNKMNKFLIKNIYKILLPDPKERILENEFMDFYNYVPDDSICFYCHFIRFDKSYKDGFVAFNTVIDTINYIENQLSNKKKMQLTVIPVDETTYIKRNNKGRSF